MDLTKTEQIAIGLWLSLAAVISIESHTLNGIGLWSLMGAVLIGPGIAARYLKLPNRSRIGTKLAGLALILALGCVALAVFTGVERLLLVNADSYPRWMATGVLPGKVTGEQVGDLHKTSCKGEPIEILRKSDGYVLRCGLWWPGSHTYLAASLERPYGDDQ